MVRFLDPEIVEMVERSYINFFDSPRRGGGLVRGEFFFVSKLFIGFGLRGGGDRV